MPSKTSAVRKSPPLSANGAFAPVPLSVPEATAPQPGQTMQGNVRDLGNLLASADFPLLFVDRELRLRGFTPAVQTLLPLTPSSLGRSVKKHLRALHDPSLLSDMQEVLDGKSTRECEIVSGSGRAYVRRALPYRDESDPDYVAGVVLTFMDITRRKLAETALRTSEERLRLILEGIAEYAIMILDPEGRFLTWPASAQRLLGYTPEEALGHPLTLLYSPEDLPGRQAEEELAAARAHRSISRERWHRRKNDDRFWGTEVLSALHDEAGRMYGFVKVLRDNTDRKLVEENLRRAKSDAELANSAKDLFLATISHELRTPLSATLLWAKLLTADGTQHSPQTREGLDAILKSAEEQQALIEDLMDISRIVAGKLRLKLAEVPLLPLLESAAENIRPTAHEAGLQLETSLDAQAGFVRADPLRLRQVLDNLLKNAVKFTPFGGRIRLEMAREGDKIIIAVSDTGQGIDAELMPHIFDRFFQAENSASRATGGMGLGLSIAKQLVELHGGTIGAASAGLAKGATFTLRLPLPRLRPARKTASPRPLQMTSLLGLEILLVEDVPETRKALAAVLLGAGAKVIAVADAPAALRAFNQQRPDVILSDIGLGKISGHELIYQIRQWEKAQKTPHVPAIALTAFADEKNRELALQCGFDQVLTKPIEPVDLVTALAALHDTH